MNDTVSRKYILILAGLSVASLIIGAFLRPKKFTPEPPSPSEMASLQERVRREQIGEMAAYFAKRAQAVAKYVVYSPENGSSAVAWQQDGQVLTTRATGPDSLEPLLVGPSANVSKPSSTRDPAAGGWILIVARTREDQLLWTPAVFGGSKPSKCNGETYRELIINARLGSAMSGAGVFDLDGALIGVVANCSSAYSPVSAESIPSLLKAFGGAGRRLEATYGFQVEQLNDSSKLVFAADRGLLVTEVRQGDAAAESGLQPGDVITGLQDQPPSGEEQLWNAMQSKDDGARMLQILRGKRALKVQMPVLAEAQQIHRAEASAGIRMLPPPGTGVELYVTPDSPAYRSGLRTGDFILQIGGKLKPTASDLARALSSAEGKPVLIVYQRDRARKVVLVSK